MRKAIDFLLWLVVALLVFSAFGYGAFRVCSEWLELSIKISVCVACAVSAMAPFLLWHYYFSLTLQAQTELERVVSNNNISKIARF